MRIRERHLFRMYIVSIGTPFLASGNASSMSTVNESPIPPIKCRQNGGRASPQPPVRLQSQRKFRPLSIPTTKNGSPLHTRSGIGLQRDGHGPRGAHRKPKYFVSARHIVISRSALEPRARKVPDRAPNINVRPHARTTAAPPKPRSERQTRRYIISTAASL